jgi:molybdopterin converting factor subunit 1
LRAASEFETLKRLPLRPLHLYTPGTMRVRLLLFALYRELAGTAELELELPPGATAADAVEALRARSSSCARIPERPVIAVNQAYASLTTALSAGDELALLPPVAGG